MTVALSQDVRSVKWYFSIRKPSTVISVSVRDFLHGINKPQTFIPDLYILYGYVTIARGNCVDIKDIHS